MLFIEDGDRKPREEQFISNLDKTTNTINLLHRHYPGWNGSGITLSVKEDRPDTADIDFLGRYLSTPLSSSVVSSHATTMATMAAGGGNTWHLGKGVAWRSTISSSDFATLLPDADNDYRRYNVSVQNHSYGVGIENYYGADAAAYDATAIDHPGLLHVFSAGNSGTATSLDGAYAGIPGVANLTGSFKMAKNILTVGATDSFRVVAALSSKGPAYDGRIKPELVAFGEDGSSGAAALVSGTALVLQQQYQSLHGNLPPNALVRAILVNSTDDTGTPGPDFQTGYGSLNAVNAIRTVESGRFYSGDVAAGETRAFMITVPEGIQELKLSLAWNDPPATPNAPAALVHDLDLSLLNIATNEIWQPWVLNSFPHPDSLQLPATRQRDSLNNIEQVSVLSPAAGQYMVRITGRKVTATAQSFTVAYQLDSTDRFEWLFPTSQDYVFPATATAIRWHSTMSRATGVLDYTTDGGNHWTTISNSQSLQTGLSRWQSPDERTTAQLRMTIGDQQFLSDTFTVAQRITTGVGFNCTDSFLLYWSTLPGTERYRVYTTGSTQLEPILDTTGDFIVLAKNAHTQKHYAIAPLIGNTAGVKSYTFNYTTQGVACYIRSFYAILDNNAAQLELSLGTLYHINSVILEKSDGRNFINLQQVSPVVNTILAFTDGQLRSGANTYRIRLELEGGGVVYSSVETVYYFPDRQYILYPNPVQQYQGITILTADPAPERKVLLYNSIGIKMAEYTLNNTVTLIPAARLSKGMYFFRFVQAGKTEKTMKVIVL